MTVLPGAVSRFIGRERQIADVERLVEYGRLVTLTAGRGKTRLALAVATGLRRHFLHGVVFVPLANVQDADVVPTVVAQALGITERPGEPTPRPSPPA